MTNGVLPAIEMTVCAQDRTGMPRQFGLQRPFQLINGCFHEIRVPAILPKVLNSQVQYLP
jgi:hypothetical protein